MRPSLEPTGLPPLASNDVLSIGALILTDMIACEVSNVYEVRLPQQVVRFLDSMRVIVTLGLELPLRATPLACFDLDGYAAEVERACSRVVLISLPLLG